MQKTDATAICQFQVVYKPALAQLPLKTSEGYHSAADVICFGFTVHAPNDFGHYNERLHLPECTVNTNW